MTPKKMTKVDLIDAVSQTTLVERKVLQTVVESVLMEIKKSLKSGSTLELRGFGTFEVHFRKGRDKARNPRTGEPLKVAPHYVAAFRPGKELRDAIRELPVKKSRKK